MTVAQTKAKRHFWKKIYKRYRSLVKDKDTAKRKEMEKLDREKERVSRGFKK